MNPQSSRSSIALGPVPTAPKPAPNPITTNMPQFGVAPGLTNADGVPTLPPVSPAATQPLTPAPTPATPTPTPISTMPQYANTSTAPATNNRAGSYTDTPVEQFNPFSSMSNPESTSPEDPKSSHKSNKLDLILGIISGLFIIAAVVFFILWRQAASSTKVVQLPSSSTPDQSIDDPTQNPAQSRRLSCSKVVIPDESQLATGIVSGSTVYDAYYVGADPTEVHISSIAEYDSPEAAAAAYANTSEQEFEYVYSTFMAFGIDITAENFTLDGNAVIFTVVVPVERFTNPEADVFSRQMLASLAGFPAQLSDDDAAITIQTDIDAVRTNYEATGLTCEIIAE